MASGNTEKLSTLKYVSMTNIDDNTLYGTTSGTGSAISTCPTSGSGDYYFILLFGSLQIAVRYKSNTNASYAIYSRRHINSAWRDWQELGRAPGNAVTYSITLSSGWSASAAEVNVTDNIGFLYVRGLKKSSTASGWQVAGTITNSIVADKIALGCLCVDSSISSGSGPVAECRVNTSGQIEVYSPQANAEMWGGFAFLVG